MHKTLKVNLACASMVSALIVQLAAPLSAFSYYHHYYYARTHHRSVYHSHPILSRTLTGAAVGTAGGAAVGLLGGHRHRVGHDALIGAGVGSAAGLGLGMFRNHQYNHKWL